MLQCTVSDFFPPKCGLSLSLQRAEDSLRLEEMNTYNRNTGPSHAVTTNSNAYTHAYTAKTHTNRLCQYKRGDKQVEQLTDQQQGKI